MSDLDLDRLEALRAAAADHKCEEETGYMHPCPRAEFSLAVHETFPALLRAAREKEVLFLEREAMLADHKEMRAADVAVLTRRAEEAENLRDQFESRVRAAEQGEETATRRAEAAEARAEKAEARATAATDALSSLIDWTRRYIEAHPSAQDDSEATLRALLAAENKPENPKRPEEKCSPCGEAQYHNPAACFCPCHRPEEGMSVKNLTEAVALIEAELPGWLWEFSNITNEAHAMRPFGTGVSLLLRPADDAVRVWDKEKQDALVLAGRAIERARRRMSGEVGA